MWTGPIIQLKIFACIKVFKGLSSRPTDSLLLSPPWGRLTLGFFIYMLVFMTKSLKNIGTLIQSIFTLGCVPPYKTSHNRITIFTNSMGLWGLLSLIPIISTLRNQGIDMQIFAPFYFGVAVTTCSILLLNYVQQTLMARLAAVLILNLLAWQAAVVFGRSFNGYLAFFTAVMYSIISLW